MLAAVTKAAVGDFSSAGCRRRRRRSPCQQDQEAGRRIAELARRKSDILATGQSASAAAPRHRLRGRDRAHHRACEGEARPQRLRLDRRQRRFAAGGAMGGDSNTVHLVTARGVGSWPPQSKQEVAHARVLRIAEALAGAEADRAGSSMRLPHAGDLPPGLPERARSRDRSHRRGAVGRARNIAPGQRAAIPTGIALRCPPASKGRSGRAPTGLRHGITVLNCRARWMPITAARCRSSSSISGRNHLPSSGVSALHSSFSRHVASNHLRSCKSR